MKTSLLKGIIYGQRQIIREAKIIPREYSFDPNFNYVLVGLRREMQGFPDCCILLADEI